jgi:hypothetical protein
MPVTLMEKVQDALAASVAPDKLIVLVPATAAKVPPPQTPVCPFGVATTKPAGSVSLKAIPLKDAVVFGLLMLNVSDVLPFNGMLAAPKTVLKVGGPTTVKLAFDVLPLPPSIEVTATLLFFTPPVVPVTFNEIVQVVFGARVAADSVTDDDPATAVAVPVHVLFKALGVAITKPAGSVSVNAIPVSGIVLPAGALIVKVSEVELVVEMLDVPNAPVIAGGAATVKVADAVFPVPPFVEPTLPVLFK